MKKALGAKRVAEPRDNKYSANHDISDKKVYEWWKKEAKARSTYYNHYSPCCKSFSAALRGLRERSKDAPYGIGAREGVMDDNDMFIRSVRLCMIHHAVGDAFSLEHIYPTLAMEFA